MILNQLHVMRSNKSSDKIKIITNFFIRVNNMYFYFVDWRECAKIQTPKCWKNVHLWFLFVLLFFFFPLVACACFCLSCVSPVIVVAPPPFLLVLSCLFLSCLVLSCLVLSCLFLLPCLLACLCCLPEVVACLAFFCRHVFLCSLAPVKHSPETLPLCRRDFLLTAPHIEPTHWPP
jgi:hypothetical protein